MDTLNENYGPFTCIHIHAYFLAVIGCLSLCVNRLNGRSVLCAKRVCLLTSRSLCMVY